MKEFEENKKKIKDLQNMQSSKALIDLESKITENFSLKN